MCKSKLGTCTQNMHLYINLKRVIDSMQSKIDNTPNKQKNNNNNNSKWYSEYLCKNTAKNTNVKSSL